jgi:hypothetical protein
MNMKLGFYLLLLTLFLCASSSVKADYYQFDGGHNNSYTTPQIITSPEQSQYIYGYLSRGEDKMDYYVLNYTEAVERAKIELLVQDKETTRDFRPSLVLVDPAQRAMYGKVPFGFPETVGGRVYPWENLAVRKTSDDTVSENFLVGPGVVKDLPQNRYVLAVFDPEGTGGKYVLHISAKKPKETIEDKFRALWAFVRIKFDLY